MSFIDYLITAVFCISMFALIFTSLYIDEQEKDRMKLKTWKLYTFADGSQLLTRANQSSREIMHEIERRGKVISVVVNEEMTKIERNKEEE